MLTLPADGVEGGEARATGGLVEPSVGFVVQSGGDNAVDAERLEVRQELVDAVPAGGRGERALGEAEDVDGHAGRMA